MKKITALLVAVSIGLLALLAAGCGKKETPPAAAPENSLTKINYADLGITTNTAYLYFGVEKGIYKKHGIDLNIIVFTKGGPEVIASIASGDLDMGQLGTPILIEITKKVPIKVVGAPAIKGNEFVLVGGNEITSVEELKGKTVGVSSIGGGQHQALRLIAQKHGLLADDINVIAAGSSSNAYVAFKSGKLSGMVFNEPWVTRIELAKEGRVLAEAKDYFGRYQHSYIFATNKFIQSNPAAIKAFFAANKETIEYAKQHKQELIAFAKTKLKLDEALLGSVFDKAMPEWDSSGKVDPEGLQNAVKILQSLGDIDKNLQVTNEQLMDLRFAN